MKYFLPFCPCVHVVPVHPAIAHLFARHPFSRPPAPVYSPEAIRLARCHPCDVETAQRLLDFLKGDASAAGKLMDAGIYGIKALQSLIDRLDPPEVR